MILNYLPGGGAEQALNVAFFVKTITKTMGGSVSQVHAPNWHLIREQALGDEESHYKVTNAFIILS